MTEQTLGFCAIALECLVMLYALALAWRWWREEMQWQPISTAAKDGKCVLLYSRGHGYAIGYWLEHNQRTIEAHRAYLANGTWTQEAFDRFAEPGFRIVWDQAHEAVKWPTHWSILEPPEEA